MSKKINLKNLLNENTPGFENRKFGDSLPTLASVQQAYQDKHGITENEDGEEQNMCEQCGGVHEGECVKEAAPKMRVRPYEKELKAAMLSLKRFENMARMEDPSAHSKNKGAIAKAMKALQALKYLR
tara:strand:+ start:1934 stop:2314 length:381 start_codon:yes stop_codon:yes gene_type:complete